MSNTSTLTNTEIKITAPRLWKVVFHNDDFTPFEFVQAIIMKVYNKSKEDAFRLTKEVHEKGKSTIGTYTKEIATTKVEITVSTAIMYNYPLMATAEEA